MHTIVYDNPDQLARSTAEKIIGTVEHNPNALLCLAGGETPRLTYRYTAAIAKDKGIDFSAVQFVSLDEWIGVSTSNTGSCYYFLQQMLFAPLDIPSANIHFFDACAVDLDAECKRIDNIIGQLKDIDLMLVGIGMNGHIGFNEPGVAVDQAAHTTVLDISTQQVGQKYFLENTALQKGITLGMAQFMQAQTAILLASGITKAAIIKKALEEEITNAVPASFIQKHGNAFVMLDMAAASLLQ